MDNTPTTETTATPDLSTNEGRESHFEAAMNAAIEATGEKLPTLSDLIETDPVTGIPVDNKADIQEAEENQAKAEKKAEAKADADDEDDTEDKEPEPVAKPEDKLSPGTLGKARRLLAEGKVEEALELALGINFDKIEPTTKQWKGVKRYAQEARQEAQAAREYAEQEINQARHVVSTLRPFVDAAQCYLKGDIAGFLQLATGDTPEQFQEKLIKSVHSAPESDPRLAAEIEAIKKERAAERQAAQREREQLAKERAQMQYEQAVQNWKQGIASELATSEDANFKKLAAKPAFIEKVYAKQAEFLDPRTKTTIDTLEAASMVFDELYGDLIPVPAGGQAGSTQAPKGQKDAPTARTGKAGVTSLRQHKTEAAPASLLSSEYSKDNQERILNHFIRLTEAELQS